MSQIAPTPADPIPTAPQTTSPSTFDSLADAFVGAWATVRTQFNALATNAYNNAVDCYNNAVAAAASAVSAVAAANAIKWVSGTTYAIGDGRWSPINGQSYRRLTVGAGTTDPSADPTNWVILGGPAPWLRKTSAYSAASGDRIKASTTGGGWNLTFPASPSDGDQIEVQDVDGKFNTNKLTLLVNGNKIMGFTTSCVADIQYFHGTFIYDVTNGDWRL